MLFWTFCSQNLDPYDIDKQETKLTIIVTIGSKIWGSFKKKALREEMTCLIYYCFSTCSEGYKNTCSQTFRNFEYIPAMLDNFLKLQNDQAKIVKKKAWFNNKGKVVPVARVYAKKKFIQSKKVTINLYIFILYYFVSVLQVFAGDSDSTVDGDGVGSDVGDYRN